MGQLYHLLYQDLIVYSVRKKTSLLYKTAISNGKMGILLYYLAPWDWSLPISTFSWWSQLKLHQWWENISYFNRIFSEVFLLVLRMPVSYLCTKGPSSPLCHRSTSSLCKGNSHHNKCKEHCCTSLRRNTCLWACLFTWGLLWNEGRNSIISKLLKH